MCILGRKLKPLSDRSTNLFNFQYPLDDPIQYGIMEKAYAIIKRENLTFDKFCVNAVGEYVARHFDGNYQTLLGSYEEDGIKSEGQREQEMVRYYLDRNSAGYDVNVKYSDIVASLRDRLDYKGSKLISAADRLAKCLHEKGIKVWR